MRVRREGAPSLRWWTIAAVLVLAGNALWEVAQMPLYAISHPLLGCLRAALTDTVLTLAAVIVARRMTVRHSHAFWPTLIGLLLSAGAGIEALALAAGHWAYSPAMATLGGVGLVPLVQLALIATVAIGLAGRLDRASQGLAAVSGPHRRTPGLRG